MLAGHWEDVQGGAFEAAYFCYSYVLPLVPNMDYIFTVSDSYLDGMGDQGWMTFTCSNETVLFSSIAEKFVEAIISVHVGGDGSMEVVPNVVRPLN